MKTGMETTQAAEVCAGENSSGNEPEGAAELRSEHLVGGGKACSPDSGSPGPPAAPCTPPPASPPPPG